MIVYKIGEKLEQIKMFDYKKPDFQFVMVLNGKEWNEHMKDFDMGIEWEFNAKHINNTRAEVNYDSITGKFLVLDREKISNPPKQFAFSLDEKGVIFIDDEGFAALAVTACAACLVDVV